MSKVNGSGEVNNSLYDGTRQMSEKRQSKKMPTNEQIVEAMKDLASTPEQVDFSENRTLDVGKVTRLLNSKPKVDYPIGPRIGNTRYINAPQVLEEETKPVDPSVVQEMRGFIKDEKIRSYFKDNKGTSDTRDGYIGDSRQKGRGDCYFLAEINAIRNTKGGQKLLTDNCKKNVDGSYTVTLPGAQQIRQKYAAEGRSCEVTGTYVISKSALEKAGRSNKYSSGDLEVVAFELAMEAYRAEMKNTVLKNSKTNDQYTAEGSVGNVNGADVLSGGYMYDAGFILTGKKSEYYQVPQSKNKKLYKAGEYGFISREQMAQRTGADISVYNRKAYSLGVSEVSKYTKNERAIDTYLNKYQGKENKYALTFSVRVAEDGPDGTTKAGGYHALTVLKITDDTVYVANPWYPDKIEPIPRDKFVKMATSAVATPIETSTTNQPRINGGNGGTGISSETDIRKLKDLFEKYNH